MMMPLTGKAGFTKFAEIAFPNGGEIWLKASHSSFFVGEATPDGDFPIYATSGTGTDRKRSNQYANAYQHLEAIAQSNDGGVFFIPGKPTQYPLKDYCHASDLLSAEMDSGSPGEQWERVKWFSEVSGLVPALIIGSGGKSIHTHWKLTAPIDITTRTHLGKLLAIALLSDPAVARPQQPMRCPGFYRREKGRHQTLESWSNESYTIDQMWDGFSRVFDAFGCPLLTSFSDERWQRLNRVLVEKEDDCKRDRLSLILRMTEQEISPPRQSVERDLSGLIYSDAAPLEIFLPRSIQDLISSGAGEGNRDNAAFKVGRNLVATASLLTEAKIPFNGDPQSLFSDFCNRLSPPLPERDLTRIWRSASNGTKTHLTEDHLKQRYSYWQWQQLGGKNKDKNSEEYKQYQARLREDEKAAEEAIWEELTQLTADPWKIINEPQIDLEKLGLEPGAIYIVKSAKGTHKTNALPPIVNQYKNVYAWFNRVALGREECNRIGVQWHDDFKPSFGNYKVGFCADSAYKHSPSRLRENGLLIVDECDQVFDHCFGDTCNKNGKRPLILDSLKNHIGAVIAGNGISLFMSADVTDRDVDYIKALAPIDCPVRVIVNEYKPKLGTISFDISENPDVSVADLLSKLEAGESCFVIDDVKNGINGCKSIAEFIRKMHPEWDSEIVEINSDTSGDPIIIDYLKNLNTASLTTRLLACSPSVVSGISIQNGHFTGIYGFGMGVLTCSQFSQALARNRGAKNINLWVAEKGLIFAGDRSLFPSQIKDYYKRNYEQNVKHILALKPEYNALTDEWSSPHFDLYCKNGAYRNLCMSNLRARMRQTLEDEGYEIDDVLFQRCDTTATGLKTAWYALEITRALAVAAARLLTDEQLRQFENSSSKPTPEQQLDLEKTFLYKTFGSELVDAMVFEHKTGKVLTGCAAMYLKDDRGKYRKQLEAFHLLQADQKEAIAKDLAGELRQLENGERFAGDIRWRSRQRKARKFLGLHKFLDPNLTVSPPDYAEMAVKARKHPCGTKDALNLDVRKMTPGQLYGELMGQIGLELHKEWASDRSSTGRRYKTRTISAQSWEYAQMYCRHKIAAQHDDVPVDGYSGVTVHSQQAELMRDHPPQSIYSKPIGGGDQGLDYTEHGLEGVSLPKNILRKTDHDEVEKSSKITHETTPGNVPVEGISSEDVANCLEWLMKTDTAEDAAAIWNVAVVCGQRVVEGVKRLLPSWKWQQLQEWEAIA
jgi:hypothetical protein